MHFELGWNQVLEAGGVLIGELVTIEIEIEALRATVPAAESKGRAAPSLATVAR